MMQLGLRRVVNGVVARAETTVRGGFFFGISVRGAPANVQGRETAQARLWPHNFLVRHYSGRSSCNDSRAQSGDSAEVRSASSPDGGDTSAGGGSTGGDDGREPAPAASSDAAAAARDWHVVVEGTRERPRRMASSWYSWLGKRIAIYHLRSVAPHANEEGRFDDLESDVERGAKQCMQFLADNLGGCGSNSVAASTGRLVAPNVETVLSERLVSMVDAFRSAGCSWHWELHGIADVRVERLFVIVGASRGGQVRRGPISILGAFGQQFVLSEKQAKAFLDRKGGLMGRVTVLQELLFDDMVLVVDVTVKATQRSALQCPDGCLEAAPCSPGKPEEEPSIPQHVEHMLRLEMALSPERNYGSDEPVFRASSWQIADWNWVCGGNHPALPRGVEAPPRW